MRGEGSGEGRGKESMREDSQTGKRSNAAREDKHSGDHLKRE